MLTPKDVFTPTKPPVDKTNVYAHRGDPERLLAKSLERNAVAVVYGEYGVGKTSLARHVLARDEQDGRLVNIENVYGKTLADVTAELLQHVGYEVTRSRSAQEQSASTAAFGTEVGGSPFGVVSAKLTGSFTKLQAESTTIVRELAVTAPTDSTLLDICESFGLALVVDEMHRASTDFVRAMTAFIKAYSNRPCKRFRIVLLGTGHDATRLVELDQGVDRVIQEIPLPLLSPAESQRIVVEGFEKLAIAVVEEVVADIVRVGVGSPGLIQSFALETAEAAFQRTPRKPEKSDVANGVEAYVKTRATRLEEAYMKAIETTGRYRYRKQILHAMSQVEDDYVTMDKIVAKVSEQIGGEVQSSALSGPLRELKSPSHGEVLRDVERNNEGGRVFNLTAFKEPAMRAFIRMRLEAEKTAYIKPSSWDDGPHYVLRQNGVQVDPHAGLSPEFAHRTTTSNAEEDATGRGIAESRARGSTVDEAAAERRNPSTSGVGRALPCVAGRGRSGGRGLRSAARAALLAASNIG